VRKIDAALDLSWLRSELASHYSSMGRPSIDPELMIRMLVVGYVFALRSERLICREVQVNLAYRWFCKLGIEDAIPDHSAFSRARNERFREGRRHSACVARIRPLDYPPAKAQLIRALADACRSPQKIR
jgi:transposase